MVTKTKFHNLLKQASQPLTSSKETKPDHDSYTAKQTRQDKAINTSEKQRDVSLK